MAPPEDKSAKKIVFLDCDGVLSSPRCRKVTREHLERVKKEKAGDFSFSDDIIVDLTGSALALERKCVDNLKWLIEASEAKVVFSTNWRKHIIHRNFLFNTLDKEGIEVIGDTLQSQSDEERGSEICAWLKSNTDVSSFVILDDQHAKEFEKSRLQDQFVKTEDSEIPHDFGLTKEKAEEALAKLSHPCDMEEILGLVVPQEGVDITRVSNSNIS